MGKSRQKEYRQAGHPRARGSGHTTGIDARTSAGKKTFSGPQRCCDDRDSPEKLVQGRGTLVSCENVQGLSQTNRGSRRSQRSVATLLAQATKNPSDLSAAGGAGGTSTHLCWITLR